MKQKTKTNSFVHLICHLISTSDFHSHSGVRPFTHTASFYPLLTKPYWRCDRVAKLQRWRSLMSLPRTRRVVISQHVAPSFLLYCEHLHNVGFFSDLKQMQWDFTKLTTNLLTKHSIKIYYILWRGFGGSSVAVYQPVQESRRCALKPSIGNKI